MSDDLLAAVYAAPDDDAPREAIARAGGPRGDFVALQLARARGEKLPRAGATRERELLQEHAAQWLEPYDQCLVATSVKWERGFPIAARLNLGGRWTLKRSLAHVPALATLHKLDLGQPDAMLGEHVVAGILALPALHHLRELRALPPSMLAALARARAPYALETIVCRLDKATGDDSEADEKHERATIDKALAQGTGLPALVDLKLSWGHGADEPAHYAWLFDSDVGRRLKLLRIHNERFARSLWRWVAALTKARDTLALEALELSVSEWELRLERTPEGFTRLTGDISKAKWSSPAAELRSALPKLPQLTEVAVKGYPT